ncbi:MAG: protein kinase, partial [Deltaproteobacteria bacterium]|nr:protein kinase [Deltaproteobacteria bacterium]
LFGVLSFLDPGVFRVIDNTLYHFYTTFFGSTTALAPQAGKAVKQILDGPFLTQPLSVLLTELGLLFFLGCALSFFSSRLNERNRFFFFVLLVCVSLATAMCFFVFLHSWLRLTLLLASLITIYLAMTFYRASAMESLARENFEANRTLGLSLQRQGHLDEALEKYQRCPLDRETRELLYQLGLDYEERGAMDKALLAYQKMKTLEYKDVQDRIRELGSEQSPDLNLKYLSGRQEELSESFLRSRKSVGRYQIIEKLGKGTTGLVYKGLDPKLNRLVAIKIIRFSDDFDEDMIEEIKERFLREAEIAGRLSHPGIVTIHDVGEDDDLTYMAMEYLEGESLVRYCSNEKRLTLTRVLDVVAKVAEALDYAHKQGVIHRDIKPANIMLLHNGNIKVTDFGIAKAISSTRTKTGVILGTPNYMSPEQIMGHKIDARTDIFSLGVLFFQLLTGKLPFHGENLSGLLYNITQGKHPSVRLIESGIPKACEQIIDKALAKNPTDRFRTAGQMARYLTMLLSKIEELSRKKVAVPSH